MATIIEATQVEWGHSSRGKYPWDEWFDGQARLLVQGSDFTCSVTGFRAAASQAARRRGVTTRSKLISANTVALQAIESKEA